MNFVNPAIVDFVNEQKNNLLRIEFVEPSNRGTKTQSSQASEFRHVWIKKKRGKCILESCYTYALNSNLGLRLV